MDWQNRKITTRERNELRSKIEAGSITVFRVPPRAHANSWQLLSGSERQAALGKARLSDRYAYIACRAVLRKVIGSLTDCEPASVSISVSTLGKPEVASNTFSFSISHARGMSLVALATRGFLGVDIECRGKERDALVIAELALSPPGRELVFSAPKAERGGVFLQEWTKTEAVAKATGRGLVIPADDGVREGFGVVARSIQVGKPWVAAIAAGPSISQAPGAQNCLDVSVR